jgi:hypothetical protein
LLILATRQGGKSLVAAALALLTATLKPNSLVLLLSASERQSAVLFQHHFMRLYHAAGKPIAAKAETALTLHLANNSRVISLPSTEKTVRGYPSVSMLIVDEAARVDDGLYKSVRPMLAVSNGSLVVLSTPFGKRGWFYEAWTGGSAEWTRVQVTAAECPRISAEFLAAERLELGDRWYRQEYECSFEDTVAAVFLSEDIAAMARDDIQPLDLGL